MMRIASLLPSATEILFALGLGDNVVAVSHDCDYPSEASKRPVLTKAAIHQKIHRSVDVDRVVELRGGDIYEIDERLLEKLQPELILTQELCAVCAVSYTRVKEAASVLDVDTKIVSLEPSRLEDILDNILLVGKMTDRLGRAQELTRQLHARINAVKRKTRDLAQRPRVFFMEWLQPPWAGGHWIPQMVDYAGGTEGLGRIGKASHRIDWSEVLEYQPDIIVLSPCGYDVNGIVKELPVLRSYPKWDKIPAFKSGTIYAVSASAYFSRPGPRIVDGLELLAQVINPELFPRTFGVEDVIKVDLDFLRA